MKRYCSNIFVMICPTCFLPLVDGLDSNLCRVFFLRLLHCYIGFTCAKKKWLERERLREAINQKNPVTCFWDSNKIGGKDDVAFVRNEIFRDYHHNQSVSLSLSSSSSSSSSIVWDSIPCHTE